MMRFRLVRAAYRLGPAQREAEEKILDYVPS